MRRDVTAARIARCKGCEHNNYGCCFCFGAIVWETMRHGVRPWVWEVEVCPVGRKCEEREETDGLQV